MDNTVSSVCHEIHNQNYEMAIQHYSLFFQKLIAAIFRENRTQTVILKDIINSHTTFHSAIVHFLYFMKYNHQHSHYKSTRACLESINKCETTTALIKCSEGLYPYIYLPPNFNAFLSKALGIVTTELQSVMSTINQKVIGDDFFSNNSKLFTNILNGYTQCNGNLIETALWYQQLKTITLLCTFFNFSLTQKQHEINEKAFEASQMFVNLQSTYKDKYETMIQGALQSFDSINRNFDALNQTIEATAAQTISRLSMERSDLIEKLNNRDETIRTTNLKVEEENEKVKKQDGIIEAKEYIIVEKDRKISSLETKLGEREKEIAEKDARIQELCIGVIELEEIIDELRSIEADIENEEEERSINDSVERDTGEMGGDGKWYSQEMDRLRDEIKNRDQRMIDKEKQMQSVKERGEKLREALESQVANLQVREREMMENMTAKEDELRKISDQLNCTQSQLQNCLDEISREKMESEEINQQCQTYKSIGDSSRDELVRLRNENVSYQRIIEEINDAVGWMRMVWIGEANPPLPWFGDADLSPPQPHTLRRIILTQLEEIHYTFQSFRNSYKFLASQYLNIRKQYLRIYQDLFQMYNHVSEIPENTDFLRLSYPNRLAIGQSQTSDNVNFPLLDPGVNAISIAFLHESATDQLKENGAKSVVGLMPRMSEQTSLIPYIESPTTPPIGMEVASPSENNFDWRNPSHEAVSLSASTRGEEDGGRFEVDSIHAIEERAVMDISFQPIDSSTLTPAGVKDASASAADLSLGASNILDNNYSVSMETNSIPQPNNSNPPLISNRQETRISRHPMLETPRIDSLSENARLSAIPIGPPPMKFDVSTPPVHTSLEPPTDTATLSPIDLSLIERERESQDRYLGPMGDQQGENVKPAPNVSAERQKVNVPDLMKLVDGYRSPPGIKQVAIEGTDVIEPGIVNLDGDENSPGESKPTKERGSAIELDQRAKGVIEGTDASESEKIAVDGDVERPPSSEIIMQTKNAAENNDLEHRQLTEIAIERRDSKDPEGMISEESEACALEPEVIMQTDNATGNDDLELGLLTTIAMEGAEAMDVNRGEVVDIEPIYKSEKTPSKISIRQDMYKHRKSKIEEHRRGKRCDKINRKININVKDMEKAGEIEDMAKLISDGGRGEVLAIYADQRDVAEELPNSQSASDEFQRVGEGTDSQASVPPREQEKSGGGMKDGKNELVMGLRGARSSKATVGDGSGEKTISDSQSSNQSIDNGNKKSDKIQAEKVHLTSKKLSGSKPQKRMGKNVEVKGKIEKSRKVKNKDTKKRKNLRRSLDPASKSMDSTRDKKSTMGLEEHEKGEGMPTPKTVEEIINQNEGGVDNAKAEANGATCEDLEGGGLEKCSIPQPTNREQSSGEDRVNEKDAPPATTIASDSIGESQPRDVGTLGNDLESLPIPDSSGVGGEDPLLNQVAAGYDSKTTDNVRGDEQPGGESVETIIRDDGSKVNEQKIINVDDRETPAIRGAHELDVEEISRAGGISQHEIDRGNNLLKREDLRAMSVMAQTIDVDKEERGRDDDASKNQRTIPEMKDLPGEKYPKSEEREHQWGEQRGNKRKMDLDVEERKRDEDASMAKRAISAMKDVPVDICSSREYLASDSEMDEECRGIKRKMDSDFEKEKEIGQRRKM